MAAIRIRKTIDSETLTLPELKPLIGRTVEIVIEEGFDLLRFRVSPFRVGGRGFVSAGRVASPPQVTPFGSFRAVGLRFTPARSG